MFCRNCGNIVSSGEQFCRKCGVRITEGTQVNIYQPENTQRNKNDSMQQGDEATQSGEFRIVDKPKLRTRMIGLLITSLVIGVFSANIFVLAASLAALTLTITLKTSYLSDYLIIFILQILSLGNLIYEDCDYINRHLGFYDISHYIVYGITNVPVCINFVVDILLFVLSVISCYIWIYKNKKRKKNPITILIIILRWECISCLIKIISYTVQIMSIDYQHYLLTALVIIYTNSYSICFLLLTISLILLVLSISKDPEKNYISLAEPADGKHILPKSIGLSVFLSVITLGLYEFFIWSRAIILSIRKLEDKNNVILGEWLCFMFIFPYRWYWFYTRYGKLSVISGNNNVRCSGGGGIFIFLDILQLSVVNMAMIQSTLNQLAVVMRDGDFVYGTVIKTPEPVVAVQSTPVISNADELMKYKKLLDAGVITQEEFENVKRKMLK